MADQEHYDIIEIVHLQHVEAKQESHRPTREHMLFSYVVRESSTPLRVGYADRTVVLVTPRFRNEDVHPNFKLLQECEVGQRLGARFVSNSVRVILDRLWKLEPLQPGNYTARVKSVRISGGTLDVEMETDDGRRITSRHYEED